MNLVIDELKLLVKYNCAVRLFAKGYMFFALRFTPVSKILLLQKINGTD